MAHEKARRKALTTEAHSMAQGLKRSLAWLQKCGGAAEEVAEQGGEVLGGAANSSKLLQLLELPKLPKLRLALCFWGEGGGRGASMHFFSSIYIYIFLHKRIHIYVWFITQNMSPPPPPPRIAAS